MQIEQVFIELGLQDKEPEVYLTLLKTPGIQPASIIASRANLNRTTVYKTLVKLSKIGLVTKTQHQGITCFFAEDPDKSLENLLSKKKMHLDAVNQNLMKILPDIQNMQQQELRKPKMRYYEGWEGIKRLYEDTLLEGEDIYAFEDIDDFHPDLQKWLLSDYLPRRAENNIFAYVLTPKNPANINYRNTDKKYCKETRFLPRSNFPIENEINIYGNKTAFFSYKADEAFSVILDSKSIANSMKYIFNFCWNIAK